jgi:hypothetical protein
MKLWMIPWLLPFGLLATVVSVSVFKSAGQVLVLGAGWLLVLLLASIVFRPRAGEDSDVNYWRIRRR